MLCNAEGDCKLLIIRWLNCLLCGQVYNGLPDLVVPYKRFDTASLETVIDFTAALSVMADDSTINHSRK